MRSNTFCHPSPDYLRIVMKSLPGLDCPPVQFSLLQLFCTASKIRIRLAAETLSKDKPVALYCRSGNRSKKAARILAEKGYQVVELETGFRGWAAAGKDIAKP